MQHTVSGTERAVSGTVRRERLKIACRDLEEACYERDQIAGEVTATDPYHGSLVQISLLAELSAAEQAVRAAKEAVGEAAAACHEPFPGHGHLETRD